MGFTHKGEISRQIPLIMQIMSQDICNDKKKGITTGCRMGEEKKPLNNFTYLLVQLNFYSKFVETQVFFVRKYTRLIRSAV
jgi:hypothetical protein